MLFLIAIYKGVNKFDLDVANRKEEICEYIHDLAIEYVNKIVTKLKYDKNP